MKTNRIIITIFLLLLSTGKLESILAIQPQPSQSSSEMIVESQTNPEPVHFACSLTFNEEGEPLLQYEVQNLRDSTIHIFNDPSMPNFFQGIDVIYISFRWDLPAEMSVPFRPIRDETTRALHPGEKLSGEINWWDKVNLSKEEKEELLQDEKYISALKSFPMECHLAWGKTPIREGEYFLKKEEEWQNVIKTQLIHQ